MNLTGKIEELVENELKVEDVRLLEFFQGLERYGYVEVVRAADTRNNSYKRRSREE